MTDSKPWETIPRQLEVEAAAAGVDRAVLPGQRPVPLSEAVEWARHMLAEGWYVAYEIDPGQRLVYLKLWEYGEDEPEWTDVRQQARPDVAYSFAASSAAISYCNAIVDALSRRGLTESQAIELLNLRHTELPWLGSDRIDPMRDDFPEWWAERLMGRGD